MKYRRFLNNKRYHSTACVIAEVIGDGHGGVQADLQITDCDRKVYLNFYFNESDSQGYIDNQFRKIGILREALDKLEDAMIKEAAKQKGFEVK